MTKIGGPKVQWAQLVDRLTKQKVHLAALRFPAFKNLAPGASINFTFPITVLLGRNGTNKSSILQALYGAPKGRTVAELWFETELDAIPAINENGLKQSVVHSYRTPDGKLVECIKARAPRDISDPDYWEAVKPTQPYGFDANAARAVPITINVVHLDFRGQLPAFDKYFYFPDERHLNRRSEYAKTRKLLRREYRKQDYLRRRTSQLKKKLATDAKAISPVELSWLEYILEREYTSGILLEHSLFHGHRGETIVFKTENIKQGYSEAFAGSGESAAAMLVHHIEQAPEGSLILLDEPETSLHPRAQQRILEFLADRASSRKLQIVIATHSSHLAERLPQAAIRVLRQNDEGKVIIDATISAREALHEIITIPAGKTVLVEDERAKAIVLAELETQSSLALKDISVIVRAGGTSRIYPDIKAHANAQRQGLFVVFDGDHQPAQPIPPVGELPQGLTQLKRLVSDLTRGNNVNGPEIDFVDHAEATRYIEFLRKYVHFLPSRTPEELVWSDDAAKAISDTGAIPSDTDLKKRIVSLAKLAIGLDADAVFKLLLNKFLKRTSPERQTLREIVGSIRGV